MLVRRRAVALAARGLLRVETGLLASEYPASVKASSPPGVEGSRKALRRLFAAVLEGTADEETARVSRRDRALRDGVRGYMTEARLFGAGVVEAGRGIADAEGGDDGPAWRGGLGRGKLE